jgi:hypothetical protein
VLAAGEFYGRAGHPKWFRGVVREDDDGGDDDGGGGEGKEGEGGGFIESSGDAREPLRGRLTEFFRRAARAVPLGTLAGAPAASLRGFGFSGSSSVDPDPWFMGDYSGPAAVAPPRRATRAPNVHPSAAQALQRMASAAQATARLSPPPPPLRFDPLDTALEVLAATEAARKAARLGSSGGSNNGGLWLAAHPPKGRWANWGAGGAAAAEAAKATFDADADAEEALLGADAEAAALASLGAFWRAVATRSPRLMEAVWTGRRDASPPPLHVLGDTRGHGGTAGSGAAVGRSAWATAPQAAAAGGGGHGSSSGKPVCIQPGQRVLRGLPSIEAFWKQTWAAEAAAWAASNGGNGLGQMETGLVRLSTQPASSHSRSLQHTRYEYSCVHFYIFAS